MENMDKNQIDYYRNELTTLCDAIINDLEEDINDMQNKISILGVKNISLKEKAFRIFKTIIRAGLEVSYENSVNNNVTISDLDLNEVYINNDRLNENVRLRSKIYSYNMNIFKKLINCLQQMKDQLSDDQNMVRFINALLKTKDSCDRKNHSNYKFILLYLYNSGLISSNQYSKASVVERFHEEVKESSKYTMDFDVRGYVDNLLKEYETSYDDSYQNDQKQK